MKFCVIIMLLVLTSCFRENNPQNIIRSFEIELTKGNIDQEDLGSWLTEERVKSYKINNNLLNKFKFKKMNFVYSHCSGKTCSYTYDVFYTLKSSQSDSNVDVRKQAVLRQSESGDWLIDELQIIKSYIDNKKTIKI